MHVIQIDKVTKVFGSGKKRVRAVDGLELTVEPGQVFGFLGPNGAGKSTTIRMMLDLIRPTDGSVHLFGEDVRKNPAGLRKTGALVEGAMFYPFLTGRDNLRVLARTRGQNADNKIDDLARQVDLAGRIDRKVSQYSTGMKQRLGIAAALLSNWFDRPGILDLYRYMPNFNLENLRSWVIEGRGLTVLPFNLAVEASLGESLLFVGIWIAAIVTWAISIFRRQDITT